MGRNAVITIYNETEKDLKLIDVDINHGKFNERPSEKIVTKEMNEFKVGNKTGAKIGPKGSITYSANNEYKIIVTWDHPFSHSSSTYTCYSEPVGKIAATQIPTHPSGHDQKVSFEIKEI